MRKCVVKCVVFSSMLLPHALYFVPIISMCYAHIIAFLRCLVFVKLFIFHVRPFYWNYRESTRECIDMPIIFLSFFDKFDVEIIALPWHLSDLGSGQLILVRGWWSLNLLPDLLLLNKDYLMYKHAGCGLFFERGGGGGWFVQSLAIGVQSHNGRWQSWVFVLCHWLKCPDPPPHTAPHQY